MASKTARILAVADALNQFTAPELAAYLGANRRTVNKVLLSRPDLFERQGNSPNLRGRPTNIWQVIDKEKLSSELIKERTDLDAAFYSAGSGLESSLRDRDNPELVESMTKVAELTIEKALAVMDPDIQRTLARTARNFTQAAENANSRHQAKEAVRRIAIELQVVTILDQLGDFAANPR